MIAKRTAAGPVVSIIVPAHNAEATLSRSLESALEGTFQGFELMIVDDGSNDRTAHVSEEFARRDPRVTLLRKSQGGVSSALNLGIRQARGEFVARLDSDDIWHPRKLEKQVEAARADPEAALIYSFVRYIDADERVVQDAPRQEFPRSALCRLAYSGIVGGNSSVMMRRSAVLENGGYDEALRSWEDLLLFLRICAQHRLACVPEYLVGYRMRPNSLSADAENMLNSWRVARQRIATLLPQIPTFVQDWGHARKISELAGAFAKSGKYALCARLLGEAFRHDPRGTAEFLRYHAPRKISETPATHSSRGARFSRCAPQDVCRPEVLEMSYHASGLHCLEVERMRRLDTLDREMARNSAEKHPLRFAQATADQ